MKKLLLFVVISVTLLWANKTNIAVLELTGNGISQEDAAGLSNRLHVELFKTGKYTIVERSMMKEILEEHEFQNTGCTDSECAVQIGQILNVDKMVAGSVDKVGNVYSISIRIIDVATGEIEKVASDDCLNCDIGEVLVGSIGTVAQELSGEIVTTGKDTSSDKQRKREQKKKKKSGSSQSDGDSPLREFFVMGGIVADIPAEEPFSLGAEAGIISRKYWVHGVSFSMANRGENASLFYNLSKQINLNKVFSFAPGIHVGYKEIYWEKPNNDKGYWEQEKNFKTFGGPHLRLTIRGTYIGFAAKTGIDFGEVEEQGHDQPTESREGEQGPQPYFSGNIHQSIMFSVFIPKR